MSMPPILEFDDPRAAETSVAGGKGASLARLTGGGFPVPGGVIVPAGAYRAFHDAVPGLDARLAGLEPEDAAALRAQCEAVRQRLVESPLPEELEAALVRRIPSLLERGPVSVRSSATLEDLAGAAFAGQHDTYLNVPDLVGVRHAVRRCYASLWGDRAVRYRHAHGFGDQRVDMAVVIQTMVQSDVAGVAFSMNPVTGALDEVVINAAYGLGETVVSGEGDVDQLVLSKRTGEMLARHIADKAHALVGTPDGTRRVEVAVERRERPALDDDQVGRLLELVIRAERFFGFPQDTEWAIAEDQVYLLQSRPVTHFPPRWTRDEAAERFPNPITPLTWDFTTQGFHESLAHSLDLMGLPPFEGKWFERLDGYIYGNQTAVELFTSGLPVRFDSLEELSDMRESLVRNYRWVQQLPVAWARNLDRYLLGLGRLQAVDPTALSDAELWRHVLAIDALGREYFRPNLAISVTQGVLHRTLFRLLTLVLGADEAPDAHDALTSFTETKTSLVNADLYTLYRIARTDPDLEHLLRETDRREILDRGRLEAFPDFAAAFRRFLDDHGHREVDFDAYHPTWVGQPEVVLENLRLMLLQPEIPEPAEREGELRARQLRAERDLVAAVPEELRNFVAELVRLTRAYTALDDLEHYQTTRLTVPFRRALLALGARLARRGVLGEARDVFFLRRETLDGLIRGRVDDAVAAEEAGTNRTAYHEQLRSTPPHVHGEAADEAYTDGLRGLPGSPGVAEGVVCRVYSAADFARFVPGAVLVARTTNPAWTPLFYSASGVITESGGPLSHGAVTAREVGIPAVMGVRGALERLRDGQRVRVDGTRGVVSD